VIWYAINQHGVAGLRSRFHDARQVAEFAVTQLGTIGWAAWRHPHAFTVVLDTPPEPIRAKWRLASSNGQSHLIAMPGVTTEQVDALVQDLAGHRGPPRRRLRTAGRADPAPSVSDRQRRASNAMTFSPDSHQGQC